MKILTQDRQASFHYHFEKTYEAGLVLKGPEVKSLRSGWGELRGSYAVIENHQILLKGFFIKPWIMDHSSTFKPNRPKVLLLKKREIRFLKKAVEEKGLTLIVSNVYSNSKGLLKASLHLAKGQKRYDKRKKTQKEEMKREEDRFLKSRLKREMK